MDAPHNPLENRGPRHCAKLLSQSISFNPRATLLGGCHFLSPFRTRRGLRGFTERYGHKAIQWLSLNSRHLTTFIAQGGALGHNAQLVAPERARGNNLSSRVMWSSGRAACAPAAGGGLPSPTEYTGLAAACSSDGLSILDVANTAEALQTLFQKMLFFPPLN